MYRITMGRVHDRVEFRECGDSIILLVDADPKTLTGAVRRCQPMMDRLSKDISDEDPVKMLDDIRKNALFFASALFGEEQAVKLAEFYNKDYGCALRACAQYFSRHLIKKISRVQKRHGTA